MGNSFYTAMRDKRSARNSFAAILTVAHVELAKSSLNIVVIMMLLSYTPVCKTVFIPTCGIDKGDYCSK